MVKSWLTIRPQSLPLSFRVDRRVPFVLLVLGAIALITAIFSASYGEFPIPPVDVVKTFFGLNTNSNYGFVIYMLRLPRIVAAFLVGMGLAIAGTILQGLTRNPLAAPEIVGVDAGASLAAVSLIVLFPSIPIAWLPLVAFLGACISAFLIYVLAWDGGSSPMRLILVGIGIGEVALALTSLLITFGDINDVSQALIWLAGSVYGRNWDHIQAFLPWLIVFIPLSLVGARELNTLHLGDDVARGLGSAVERQRVLLLVSCVALAGASVATAGAVGFVGLMAPHLSRQLVGASHQGLIPTAALMGGLIVLLADFLGRSLFAPIELPCGLITAAVGAPYFLYLLYRNRKTS
ncbi:MULTISPECIES: iron ABC transporter permease [unclassified Leptolyngbya]|uniref:FecCD family ABC transporter permease n=1 Tax=unclassified Leptolyngbya TaxID=2650499 RepID=UPI00168562DF|nr:MULTISPECIES: iron ABC transporter permease [unclassified Leptolyngbya]MBD1909251.1 iron ABC transporter permease [Leptolyngbya sp. FACHB-8]MBD2156983.1 iron ABC transporter permease [Leptolyngbya sp. FACHB-16]